MSDEGVLILAGATASGKTNLAVELALEFDAEIVGADSRQIYRGMAIGTAAPSAQQTAAIPHHLIGFLDPAERYSAARFAADAVDAIEGIGRRGKRVIVVGGTGFYLRALLGGVNLAPQFDQTVRDRLAREARTHSAEFLHAWLALRDVVRARSLHVGDTYRVSRALEIALSSSSIRATSLRTLESEGVTALFVFLDVPFDVIDRRIAARTHAMIQAGLMEEAERIGEGAVASNAVGYPQALAHLRGWCTLDEMKATLERASRRYARRQRAWFRSERGAMWLPPDGVAKAAREKLGWSSKRK